MKGQYTSITNIQQREKTVHLICAVSIEYGIEGWFTTREHVNGPIFCRIFNEIRQQGDHCIILLDNVSYHHSKYTKAFIDDSNI